MFQKYPHRFQAIPFRVPFRIPTCLGLLLGLAVLNPSASAGAEPRFAAAMGADSTRSDSIRADSAPAHSEAADASDASDAAPAPASLASDPLLPEILSPGEKLLWGRHGFMRAIGAFPLTEESREKELSLRRNMLTAHQIGGFFTLASMIATAYCGQMIVNGETGYEDAKSVLAWTTVTAYFTTAGLSLLTPPPVVRRSDWNSVSTHKALALVHFTGMILTPLLGTMIEDDHDVQTLHQISGYATTVAFAGAMLVITF